MSQKLVVFVFCCYGFSLFCQEETRQPFTLDFNYFYGTILRHNKNVGHLVKDHPVGFIASYNHKTYGDKYWQEAYNYPDWGISFLAQDFKSEALGQNYGLYGHYNFYFLNRRLSLRIAEGIAYNTSPFDIDSNFKNISYGSHFLASTYLLIQYEQANLWKGWGIHGGVTFVHHSNGSFKAPNSGTNIVGFTMGVNYEVHREMEIPYKISESPKDFSERIKFNFLIRGGVNEGDYINLGQHPFYVISAFADKRLNYKSTLQFGVEYFVSEFLKKEIEYVSISFPGRVDADTDYKRAAVMVGHEFRIGHFAIPTQLGYYFYWPYEYESRVYTRMGVKYYITDMIFAVGTVKTHAANAENLEFGIGVRI